MTHKNSSKLSRRTVIAGIATAGAATGLGLRKSRAQSAVEVVYNTFGDPANVNDPRSAAQTRMIEAFEEANPNIKIKVVVDPSGSNAIRTARTRSDSPD